MAETELSGASVEGLSYPFKDATARKEIETLKKSVEELAGKEETDPTVPAWAKQAAKPTYTAEEVGALPVDAAIPTVPENVSAFKNDAGYLTDFAETDPTVPAWAKAASKPKYTAEEVGADPAGSAASALESAEAYADRQDSAHDADAAAHNDIRLAVQGLADRLDALLDSDDTTLDQLSELTAYIKANRTLIESVTTSKVNVADIVNDLATNVSDKPLSAAQGVALKKLVDAITVPTKVSQLANDSGFLTDVPSEYVTDAELAAKGYQTEAQVKSAVEDTIVQESGASTAAVMSQKAVTDYVASQMSNVMPEFVDSVEEMTDQAKKYVMDGTIWVYGTTTVEVEPENMFDVSKASINLRLATSAETASDGYFSTAAMPLPEGWSSGSEFKLRLYNVGNLDSSARIWFVGDDEKTPLLALYLSGNTNKNSSIRFDTDDDGAYVGNILAYYTSSANPSNPISDAVLEAAKAVRMSFYIYDGTKAITTSDVEALDVCILYDGVGGTQVVEGWYDTGMEWSAGGGGGDTADLVARVNGNAAAIAELENVVENLESGGDTVAVPAYWQEAVDEAAEKVKALQDAGGADVVNFCWFSDLHYVPTSAYTQNIGRLCAALMDECDIPFALFTGDTVTASGLPTEADMLGHIRAAADMLAPIGPENLLWLRGNHDDVWGTYADGDATVHFVNKTSDKKLWNAMHREGAKDLRRVYGDHGTYFYVDNVPQKVRFVCLNSHFYEGRDIAATAGQMTTGFGSEQLAWLRDVALDAPGGYGVVIALHVPPTAEAVNGNTYYLGQLFDGADFRSIINATDADLIAIFAGHCHADAIVAGDLPCPILTITSAVNTPYDADWSTRVAGTATETALDVVSINKATKTISCTRLGYGSDRETGY